MLISELLCKKPLPGTAHWQPLVTQSGQLMVVMDSSASPGKEGVVKSTNDALLLAGGQRLSAGEGLCGTARKLFMPAHKFAPLIRITSGKEGVEKGTNDLPIAGGPRLSAVEGCLVWLVIYSCQAKKSSPTQTTL